ncbi:MAG: transposase, partial [Candidatus Methylacidiphilales bacterium]|nr:transposase [Candidatus Methylacidiphilales bacterium]
NKLLSSIRARVEHVFGDIEMGLQGLSCRYIGQARAHAATQFKLFLYNIRRMTHFNLAMKHLTA